MKKSIKISMYLLIIMNDLLIDQSGLTMYQISISINLKANN